MLGEPSTLAQVTTDAIAHDVALIAFERYVALVARAAGSRPQRARQMLRSEGPRENGLRDALPGDSIDTRRLADERQTLECKARPSNQGARAERLDAHAV